MTKKRKKLQQSTARTQGCALKTTTSIIMKIRIAMDGY